MDLWIVGFGFKQASVIINRLLFGSMLDQESRTVLGSTRFQKPPRIEKN
jgi:hypothetical protein